MYVLRFFSIPFSGYICQDIDAEVLTEQSNPILTAIIHGMRSTEPSNHVRLAATQALLNSLEFTKANFDKDNERNFIMEVVCEATQSTDMRISVAALQCLVRSHYLTTVHSQGICQSNVTKTLVKQMSRFSSILSTPNTIK